MEKRKPEFINGRPYVEILSYGMTGERQSIGAADQAAIDYFKNKTFSALEIGVYRGQHAEVMIKKMPLNLLILVDPWEEGEEHKNNWAEAYCRTHGYEHVIIIKTRSEIASQLLNIQFDYVYIDGDHTGGDLSPGTEEEGIRKDIKLWLPKVHPKGILAGHDYSMPNVKDEVDKVFKDKVHHSDDPTNMDWWIFKGEL